MAESASPLIVVMGVSGAGKSVVGRALAASLLVDYRDGDDLHSAANVAKMAAGVALIDEDRWSWLEQVGDYLAAHVAHGAVISCSALKRSYRDVIRSRARGAVFVHLTGARAVAQARMLARTHFMPAALLDSQLQALEPLDPDELGVDADMARAPDRIVAQVLATFPSLARRARWVHPADPAPSGPQAQPIPGV